MYKKYHYISCIAYFDGPVNHLLKKSTPYFIHLYSAQFLCLRLIFPLLFASFSFLYIFNVHSWREPWKISIANYCFSVIIVHMNNKELETWNTSKAYTAFNLIDALLLLF